MKTAFASPEDGPDKKKFGIPKKDKKGLAKKTEYKYQSESMPNKKKPALKSKDVDVKGKPMKGDPSKFGKHEEWMNKPKNTDKKPKVSQPKDSQFEKSYKVVPNKLKSQKDLDMKLNAPSSKKGKK